MGNQQKDGRIFELTKNCEYLPSSQYDSTVYQPSVVVSESDLIQI
jgi:hypothetical protein